MEMASNQNKSDLGTRCVQINLQHSRVVTACLNEYIVKENIGIAALQELYCIKHSIAGINKEWRIFSTGRDRKRAAVLISDPKIDGVLLSDLSDEDFVAVEVSLVGGFSCIFVSAYFDITRDIEIDLFKMARVLERAGRRRVIMCIDTNSRSAAWYDTVTNRRGKDLEEFLAEGSLVVINYDDGQPTFETRNGKSRIDLTICNWAMLRYVSQWANKGSEEVTSDHKTLAFVLGNADGDGRLNHVLPRYNMKEADWLLFRRELSSGLGRFLGVEGGDGRPDEWGLLDAGLANRIESEEDIDGFVMEFDRLMAEACKKAIPLRTKTQLDLQSARCLGGAGN
ncbi:hypothetical protein GE061_010968 [Apolygus lucorum]|uniref:Endonuclease/exonuclease/phosphatase domain-containing protein n=1 Tax=Apolygus lucorum TaxID=248454 RepID=A0A8S9XW31_APOLU|nr:hypothetical protein GE061_010968 [Apolygus lucorum]